MTLELPINNLGILLIPVAGDVIVKNSSSAEIGRKSIVVTFDGAMRRKRG